MNLSAFQEDHAINLRWNFMQMVRDEYDGLALADLCPHEIQILEASFEIKSAGRLIKYEYRWIVDQRSSEQKPPLLPCREMSE